MAYLSDFEELLNALEKEKVEYMIAGGFAVNFYKYVRTTSDFDIWIKPSDDNKDKIIRIIKKLGFSNDNADKVATLDFTKPFAFKLGFKPIDVDIFNYITGIQYEDAEKNAIEYKYSETLIVKFISLKDLVLNKMLTGRLKDMADVEELQRITVLNKSEKEKWIRRVINTFTKK